MQLLLDTHTFLWWVAGDRRVSSAAAELLSEGANDVFLSAASAWEIAIKYALGKLPLPSPPKRFVADQLSRQSMRSLGVTMAHALEVAELPPHHRDPFDRVLVAQARLEGLPIVSADPLVARYDVEVIW